MVLYLRLINLEAAKQICQAIIAMLNVLRRGMQPILLHERLDGGGAGIHYSLKI